MCHAPATGPNGNQDGLDPISKFLARQPSSVHEAEIVNFSQFHLETFKQLVRGIVQVRIAELHVEPLAGEFDRATPSINSEQ
jgi:hypothetical protein